MRDTTTRVPMATHGARVASQTGTTSGSALDEDRGMGLLDGAITFRQYDDSMDIGGCMRLVLVPLPSRSKLKEGYGEGASFCSWNERH